ncbi:MAG: DUF4340 domain-containing protein [Bacteroidota bacterium]
MDKRTTILTLVFVIAGVVSYLLLNQTKEEGTLVGADRDFAVENTDVIHKIFLANRTDNSTTLLERKGKEWIYNGKHRARPNAIENLLGAIAKVQMKYKPPTAAVPNMLQDLATRGIKVELYDETDELLKIYYIGGGTQDERGTYIIMEDAEQPYVAHLPSWEGNIRFRYNLKGDQWRDRSLFYHARSDIEELSVSYPKQREQSFTISRPGNSFTVNPFYDLQKEQEGVVQNDLVKEYLDRFSAIGAEAFRNDFSKQDSIKNTVPFAEFNLKLKDGGQHQVTLYPIFPNNLTYDAKLNEYRLGSTQIERYFVDVNGEDFFVAQHRVVEQVLWGYGFFFR